MQKLPPGEALRRHNERNRIKNEKRKADLVAYKAANGITSNLTEERKKQMREYVANKRGPAKRKALRILDMSPEQLEQKRRDEKNAKLRAKRQAERDAGIRIDKRLKENMTKPHYKTLEAKPKEPRRMRTPKEKKMGKVITEPKPMRITNNSTAGKIALVISPKLTVFIRPDQDPQQVRAKYLNR